MTSMALESTNIHDISLIEISTNFFKFQIYILD